MLYVTTEIAIKKSNEVMEKALKDFIEYAKNPFFPYKRNIRYFTKYPSKPVIIWKKKGYGIAGTAYPAENKIEMNLNYLESPDANEFIVNTTLHELAHLINAFYGGRNHDRQWKSICHILGDDGNRCHNYRTPENKPMHNRHKLKCPDCGEIFEVSTRIYNDYKGRRHVGCKSNLIQIPD